MIKEFFSMFDIVSALFALMLVMIHAIWRRGQHASDHFRYFLPSLLFKLVLGLTFALFYVIAYNGGGDTVAYWSGAVRLSNLFFESPGEYFEMIFRDQPLPLAATGFNRSTGSPPSWIYDEQESWLVCKLFSVQAILTFKGFFAATILVIYIAHSVVWKLFEKINSYNLFSLRNTAIALLFIPSVNFWCSGVSKDTLLFVGLSLFTTTFFGILDNPRRLTQYLVILVVSVTIFHIRSVMFFTVALPMFAVISRKVINSKGAGTLSKYFLRAFSISVTFATILFFFSNGESLQSETINGLVAEAAVVQQDFSKNLGYGDSKYDLGITDFSLSGMVTAFPAAVFAGLYRPFLWEALSPSLLFNGIESAVLIYLTFVFFFKRNLKRRFLSIFRHELLVYFIITVLFIAFYAGFTSVLFGVLVRIRSFALPFFYLLLTQRNEEDELQLTDVQDISKSQ